MNEEVSVVATPEPKRRPRATRQEIAAWAKRFSESGLGQREFCRQHQLTLMTLQRWLARAENYGEGGVVLPEPEGCAPAKSPPFTEIKFTRPIRPVDSGQRWAAELCRPNGVRLRLAHDVPATLLEQLLRVC